MVDVKREPKIFDASVFDTSYVHNSTCRTESPFSISHADDNIEG